MTTHATAPDQTRTDSTPDTMPGLFGSLARLKLRLLANTFKRSPWQVVGLVIGILYGFGVAGLGVVALVALRFADAETARTATILGGSLVVLGFLLVPLVFGVDDTLDPRRFSL